MKFYGDSSYLVAGICHRKEKKKNQANQLNGHIVLNNVNVFLFLSLYSSFPFLTITD